MLRHADGLFEKIGIPLHISFVELKTQLGVVEPLEQDIVPIPPDKFLLRLVCADCLRSQEAPDPLAFVIHFDELPQRLSQDLALLLPLLPRPAVVGIDHRCCRPPVP